MEFTKWEQKVLSSRYEKQMKLNMWAGIVCVILSIAYIPFMIYQCNKVKETWESQYTYFENNIQTETELEIKLKGLILKDTITIGELSIALFNEKAVRTAMVFFIIGCAALGAYLNSKYFIKLIKKLRSS